MFNRKRRLIAELRMRLTREQAENRPLREQHEADQKTIGELRDTNINLSIELQDAQAELTFADKKKEQFLTRLDDAGTKLIDLRQELAAVRGRADYFDREYHLKCGELDRLSAELGAAKRDLHKIRDDDTNMAEQKRQIERLKAKIESLKASFADEHNGWAEQKRQNEVLLDKNAELMDQVTELLAANGSLKHTIETQQNEMHTMYEKMSAAAAQQNACPADCVRHQNPGPGGSVCRNCTRHPHAVDKYTNGKNGQEATQ